MAVISSNFLRFQYFILNDDIWHLVNFFSQNSHLFPRYWGPNFGPFRAKKWLPEWNCYFESKYMFQEHCWSISFFIFWKYRLNYTRKSKLCLLLSRNNGAKPQKAEFSTNFKTSYLNSHGHHLHILFSGFCESHLGVLILCGAKIMCKQGPGTEWSLKIQFLFKNCFATQPIMATALGLGQNVNTL